MIYSKEMLGTQMSDQGFPEGVEYLSRKKEQGR